MRNACASKRVGRRVYKLMLSVPAPSWSMIGHAAESLLRSAEPKPSPVALASYQPRVEDLLKQLNELADKVHPAAGRYIKQLGRLDNAERQLVSRAQDYDALISQHLLWVRSTSALWSRLDVRELRSGQSRTIWLDLIVSFAWLFDASAWQTLGKWLKAEAAAINCAGVLRSHFLCLYWRCAHA